jgi:MoaA/NifB/PqqE/SkfB family radical SAM enzyme
MKGIRNIVKNNCDIITNTLIMKPNLAYLKDIIKMLKKEGVKEMQLKFIDGKWLKNGYREYVPKYSECVPIIREIIEQNRDIKIWANEVPPCVLGEKYKKNIVSCVDRERFLFDSKREVKPMEEILSHRLVLPNCKGCIYKYLCGGVRKEYVQTYGIKEFNPIIKTSLSEIE